MLTRLTVFFFNHFSLLCLDRLDLVFEKGFHNEEIYFKVIYNLNGLKGSVNILFLWF